jgi:hypothetical protein
MVGTYLDGILKMRMVLLITTHLPSGHFVKNYFILGTIQQNETILGNK